jgi:hypothetical protein
MTDANGRRVRTQPPREPRTIKPCLTMTTALLESLDLSTAKSACAVLSTYGAIASLPAEPRPILIGDLQWLGESELLIFTAYGDGPADVHRVHFDEALVHESGRITFLREGNMIATIQRIEDAEIEDPDDYRIAHQFWCDVAPLYRQRIERSYDALIAEVAA